MGGAQSTWQGCVGVTWVRVGRAWNLIQRTGATRGKNLVHVARLGMVQWHVQGAVVGMAL